MTGRPQVNIVSRHAWRARSPKRRAYIKTPTAELWWHHFASEHHGPQGMRDIQSFHMDTKGWTDIAYSFCVDDDGTIYEGRGVGVAGGHTANRNSISHAICLMGNFQNRPVPRAALQSCAALAAHGIDSGWWVGWTSGHRNAPGASTACPGDFAMRALPDLRALTDLYRTAPTPEEQHDMHGTEIIAAYGEAGYLSPLLHPDKLAQHWRDIRTWTHAIYSKPEPERAGGVAYVRSLLGLA